MLLVLQLPQSLKVQQNTAVFDPLFQICDQLLRRAGPSGNPADVFDCFEYILKCRRIDNVYGNLEAFQLHHRLFFIAGSGADNQIGGE